MTAPQLRCAGCGRLGEAPRIVHNPRERLEVVIRPVFDFHPDGRPALLCGDCRGLRGRARYSKRRPSDGRTTT